MAKPFDPVIKTGKKLNRYPDNKQRWYPVMVRGRYEKKADKYLNSIDIECYLPLKKKLRYWSDRKKTVEMPLFPGYIFVYVNNIDFHRVLSYPHTIKYIKFNGQPVPLPDEQIGLVRELIDKNLRFVAVNHKFKIGDRVMFKKGLLADHIGEIIMYSGKETISIRMESIGYNLLVNLPVDFIVAAETI